MSDSPRVDGQPAHIQSGDLKDPNGLRHRGPFFDDRAKPNTCICCLALYWYDKGPTCVCMYADKWMQDELDRVTCPYHIEQKMIDGLFGALPGDFTVPGVGKPAYKRPVEGGVTPIVHR